MMILYQFVKSDIKKNKKKNSLDLPLINRELNVNPFSTIFQLQFQLWLHDRFLQNQEMNHPALSFGPAINPHCSFQTSYLKLFQEHSNMHKQCGFKTILWIAISYN